MNATDPWLLSFSVEYHSPTHSLTHSLTGQKVPAVIAAIKKYARKKTMSGPLLKVT